MAGPDKLVELLAATLARTTVTTDDLLFLAEVIGIDRQALEIDVLALMKERIAFWLLGNDVPSENFSQRKRFVDRRIRERLVDRGARLPQVVALIEAIALFQGRVQSAQASRRLSISTLEEPSVRELYRQQDYRCACCGTPLLASFRKQCGRFGDGFEPVAEAHLDHVVPYYLFGNEGEYELLCSGCNLLKNDRIGVQEDGFVISGNHVRRKDEYSIRRRTAFWTLYSIRRCEHRGCNHSSKTSILLVQPREDRIFSYGNLSVFCPEHASAGGYYLHNNGEQALEVGALAE